MYTVHISQYISVYASAIFAWYESARQESNRLLSCVSLLFHCCYHWFGKSQFTGGAQLRLNNVYLQFALIVTDFYVCLLNQFCIQDFKYYITTYLLCIMPNPFSQVDIAFQVSGTCTRLYICYLSPLRLENTPLPSNFSTCLIHAPKAAHTLMSCVGSNSRASQTQTRFTNWACAMLVCEP